MMTDARDPRPALDAAAVGILMTGTVVASRPICDALKAHRAWEIADLDGFLAETGKQIRGIAAGGRMKIDEAPMARPPSFEIVANFGVGYDEIDVALARAPDRCDQPAGRADWRGWDGFLSVVDEPPLITALASRPINAAGLDVFQERTVRFQ